MKSCIVSSNHVKTLMDMKKEGKLHYLENLIILDYETMQKSEQ